MASDWLTAVLAANQKACLKTVLANDDFLTTTSVSKTNPWFIPTTESLFWYKDLQISDNELDQ